MAKDKEISAINDQKEGFVFSLIKDLHNFFQE